MTQVGIDKAFSWFAVFGGGDEEEATLPSATSAMESVVAATASGEDEETKCMAGTGLTRP